MVALAAACASFLFRSIGGALYEVSTTDPVTFGTASALVIVMTLVASLVPALRAARTDPAIALRHD